MQCIFDINRTRYTNLDDLTVDMIEHTTKYLNELTSKIQ
jgi:hypothetical protein